MRALTIGIIAALAFPGFAQAQSSTSTTSFNVQGNVPAICAGGTIVGGSGTFALGGLADTTTGLLRTDLSAPDKTISGSFCSSRSTITISATPMAAQNFTATPSPGFSRTVNYVATASGWTTTPAVFDTGAASNTAATQTRATAFTGDIAVGISGFATGGGNALRLVADANYSGLVTVTLTAAP